MAALLFGGAAALAACASGSPDGGGVPTDKATPKPGGTFTFPLPGEPVSIEPLNAQDSAGLQVAHQVFQGLTQVGARGRRRAGHRAGHRREVGVHRRADLDLPPQDRRDVPAPGQPPGHRPGLRRLVDPGHRPAQPVLRGVHPRAHRGLRRPRLPDRPGPGPHRRQGARRPDAPGHPALPVRRLPATLGHPVAAVTPVDYIDQVGAKAFAKKPVGTGPYVVKSWRHGKEITLAKNAAYWDKAHAGVGRHHRPAHLRRRRDRCGPRSRTASSTARRRRRTRCRRSRPAARSRPARGRQARGRPPPSTSSA